MGLYLVDGEKDAAGEPRHVADLIHEGRYSGREDAAKALDAVLVEFRTTIVVVDLEKSAEGVEAVGVAYHRDGVGKEVVTNSLSMWHELLHMADVMERANAQVMANFDEPPSTHAPQFDIGDLA